MKKPRPEWTVPILVACAVLLTVGCGVIDFLRSRLAPVSERPLSLPEPVVGRLQQHVRGDLERFVDAPQASVLQALVGANTVPARFKRPFVVQGLTDPWTGMIMLEGHGHRLAELAQSSAVNLPAMISVMEAGMGRVADPPPALVIPTEGKEQELMAYIRSVMEQAHRLRLKAIRKLSDADRRFLFDHAASVVDNFSVQVSDLSEEKIAQAQADLRFAALVAEELDYAAMLAAAQVLGRLAGETWLQQVGAAFKGRRKSVTPPTGVTGEVLLVEETASGLIVVGGRSSNTYELNSRFALVLDLGGDDHYRGRIAAAADTAQGVSVVIDLAGNDTYHPSPLGLATGRLGVGLLIDHAGNDVYHLSHGSGGTGFAGIGVLYDRAGDDQYVGSRFTQGAALGGVGLLLDGGGNDTYTSFGYALGFGGPLGVGAVIDVAGDDRYQCGGSYPSSYNVTEAPAAQPGDRTFQYDAFGIGMGSGKRIFTKDPQPLSYALGGGWGIAIDLSGDDRYRSSNFSQGAGYFFGAGLKLDFAGDDEHGAARFGHGAGAHYGVGLHIDYRGADRYTSTGPYYNGGTAWDFSVTLCIDAASGNDRYELQDSDGLGRADHHAWSLFIEEGGRDQYAVREGLGLASDGSMSGFFDLGGDDEYGVASARGNGRTVPDEAGGLFVDR